MTGAEVEAAWFTPYHYFTYLGIVFILMVVYYQWRWANTCNNFIQVLVAQQGGGGKYELAPKQGGEVTITNPQDGSVRTWPVNELATIDVLYPGVGFVPAFMQKSIRLAILNEGDWEPMLNRSPHREKIASPDVVEFLKEIAGADGTNDKTKSDIEKMVKGLATGPTREMIADPAMLGSLAKSGVMKALASVSNEFMDVLKSVNAKLGKIVGPNPIVVYIGLGLIAILVVFLVFKLVTMEADVISIMETLGVARGS